MFFKLLNPHFFVNLLKKIRPFLLLACILSFAIGLYLALYASPEDYQQGDMVRMMYIHVPSAWLSLMIFMIMGLSSASCLIWKAKFAFYISLASAEIGSYFALITLLTGMIWGKPIWGAWWVWDARLTSMLILFIFYILYIGVSKGSDNIHKIEKPCCVIAILGMINVPIVKFSVDLWYSLHQPASIFKISGPAVDGSMLKPLLIMFIANLFLFVILLSLKIEILLNKNNVIRSY